MPITREEHMSQLSSLQRKYFPDTKPLPGVPELLSTLAQTTAPHVHLALATSSHAGNFALKTGHLEELFAVFESEHRVLGDDRRIPQGRGKPAPDIYLLALETVNQRIRRDGGGKEAEVRPDECLVFEDSVPGVEAGRRAGMQVVWCPHPGLLNEYKGREKEVLAGLAGMGDESERKRDAEMRTADKKTGEVKTEAEVRPGKIDDGWARLFATLEDFPYKDYGIHV